MSSYCAFHWVCEDIDIPLKILGWSFPWRLKALFFLACYSAKHLIDLIISLVQLHKEVNSWLQQLWVQSEPQQHVAEQEYQGIILALCPGQDRTGLTQQHSPTASPMPFVLVLKLWICAESLVAFPTIGIANLTWPHAVERGVWPAKIGSPSFVFFCSWLKLGPLMVPNCHFVCQWIMQQQSPPFFPMLIPAEFNPRSVQMFETIVFERTFTMNI